MPPKSAGRSRVLTGKVRPADLFELIKWLAHCQQDARKAAAELVQNSLDAGARRIDVVRRRDKGVLCLGIVDDGQGVIPELPRADALAADAAAEAVPAWGNAVDGAAAAGPLPEGTLVGEPSSSAVLESGAVAEPVASTDHDETPQLFPPDPTGDWRSRMRGGIWEVNRSHPDFREASASDRRQLRYLSSLLAKEVVCGTYPAPQTARLLEQMVRLLAIVETALE
jgi:hypothetical protein